MIFDNIYIYTNNKVSSDALKNFNDKILKIQNPELIGMIRKYNNQVINLIAEFDLQYLFISYTPSNSIFYRLKLKNSLFEFKWEVFLNSDDYENVDTSLHIYKNSYKDKSFYGSIEEIYDLIICTIDEENYVTDGYISFKVAEENVYYKEYA